MINIGLIKLQYFEYSRISTISGLFDNKEIWNWWLNIELWCCEEITEGSDGRPRPRRRHTAAAKRDRERATHASAPQSLNTVPTLEIKHEEADRCLLVCGMKSYCSSSYEAKYGRASFLCVFLLFFVLHLPWINFIHGLVWPISTEIQSTHTSDWLSSLQQYKNILNIWFEFTK